MADLVPADEIESLVGVQRHQSEHWAKAVSSEQTVYVLHSRGCLDEIASSHPARQRDLRDCPYSLALDRGIDLAEWTEDTPTRVTVGKNSDGWYLHPMQEPTPGQTPSPDPGSFIESTLPRLLDEFDAERSGRGLSEDGAHDGTAGSRSDQGSDPQSRPATGIPPRGDGAAPQGVADALEGARRATESDVTPGRTRSPDPDECSHCIMGVKPLGDGWTHIDDDPTCVDFWQNQANPLDPDACRAWWADASAPARTPLSSEAKDVSVPFVAIGAGEKAPWADEPLVCPKGCSDDELPLLPSDPPMLSFIKCPVCEGAWTRGAFTP